MVKPRLISREMELPALQIVTPTMMIMTIAKTNTRTNMLWNMLKNESKKSICTEFHPHVILASVPLWGLITFS